MKRKERKASPKTEVASVAGDGATVISGGEEAGDIRDRMIKDMQEQIRLELYNEQQKAKLEEVEAADREAQLEETREILLRHWSAYTENERILEEKENWERYMTCDGLPDPGSLSDMNTFLFLWTLENENTTMDVMADKCHVITDLLTKLERIIRFSTIISRQYAAECEVIARELRKKLQLWIDHACYRLLRHIEANMTREDMKTTRYVRVSTKLVCCVWAPIALPVGMKRLTDKERQPIEVQFEEMKLTIKMPADVDCHSMAIRGLWLAYDHYSVDTNSYWIPEIPEKLVELWDSTLSLLEFSKRDHEEKLRIRKEQAKERSLRLEEKKAILERMENPPVPASAQRRGKRGRKQKKPQSAKGAFPAFEEKLATFVPPETELLPYLPTPNEILRQREEEYRQEARKLLFTKCEKTEVNLRKYRILGGVFHVNLIYQPPQPKDLGQETSLTTLELPKEPKFVQFSRPYVPPQPAPDSERTPEVIEAEMKALETAMEALVLITLELPDTVFWFEPPLVAHWITEKNMWSTKDVHDIKYNEEKQTIAFRSGKLGVHGLAAYKFANLPFQSWELKPEMGKSGRLNGGVVLSITGATVQAEFIVREDRVCLNSLVGGSSKPLEGILKEFIELESLIERMQQVGCDLFPERDAASYLKGLATKHPIAEKHLQECMALLSTAYTFAWSRWNATRGFWEIVLQFKEVHGCVAKERTSITLLVTHSRTMRIRCTEVSPEFSDLPLDDEDNKFYADLYRLAINTAGIKTRLLIERTSFKLMTTVARLLQRTNVIGMSS
ncbi:dynein axonemal intermediate chain 7-like [Hylaeus anthracinus]|uniref:dynein axonemal intermediate chain 7-like n=1 Tax=Hylaeus anthracinus TaxID=313031 RepID=UPI0023B989A7|nr:dynein axonemal intermediate chain 7-like [Hylaeus anthracinus]XP_054006511.1 dynein axonemal intermediate chain 7-like [Hylaeus anthracinus]